MHTLISCHANHEGMPALRGGDVFDHHHSTKGKSLWMRKGYYRGHRNSRTGNVHTSNKIRSFYQLDELRARIVSTTDASIGLSSAEDTMSDQTVAMWQCRRARGVHESHKEGEHHVVIKDEGSSLAHQECQGINTPSQDALTGRPLVYATSRTCCDPGTRACLAQDASLAIRGRHDRTAPRFPHAKMRE